MAYYYLTGALKRRVLHELKMCFSHYFPEHKDILDYINHKYVFKNRPQKGIVVTNAGASPMRLSADNFQGIVASYVMLANLDQKPSVSIEWVKEDMLALQRTNQFPSEAGIYYIEIYSKDSLKNTISQQEYDDAILREGEKPFYFYVDPLLSVTKEHILTITEANENTCYLMNPNPREGSVRVFADDYLLMNGHRLILKANQSLYLNEGFVKLGFKEGHVKPKLVSTNVEPYNIVFGVNDILELSFNEIPVTIPLDSGLKSASDIVTDIYSTLSGALDLNTFSVYNEGGKLIIESEQTLEVLPSSANTLFGFEEGFVPVEIKGFMLPPRLSNDLDIEAVVDGTPFVFKTHEGRYQPTYYEKVLKAFDGLTVLLEQYGEYTYDTTDGKITLAHPHPVGTKIFASYKYPTESRGPFGIDKDTSNNKAIEGVILAFGRRIVDGDKMAVVVHDKREDVAKEYGGRWEISVDIDIITRDPMTREELSDMVLMYFFAYRKEAMTDEGLELLDVSFGGEAEEIYDDVGQDYYFNSSITLTFQTDWSIHVPLPLIVERVSPTSFASESQSGEQGWAQETSDTLVAELRTSKIYSKGKNNAFERIK